MQSIISILLVAALNLLPAGVKEFTLTPPDEKALHFALQADGGWKGLKKGQTNGPTFYLDGTQLTMKNEGKEFASDLGPVLGVNAGTVWKEVKELKIGADLIGIERQADGVDFTNTSKNGEKEVTRRFKVRWGAPAAKEKPVN
jgi:hypothetical protein